MLSRITFTVETDGDGTAMVRGFADGIWNQAIWAFEDVDYTVEVDVK